MAVSRTTLRLCRSTETIETTLDQGVYQRRGGDPTQNRDLVARTSSAESRTARIIFYPVPNNVRRSGGKNTFHDPA